MPVFIRSFLINQISIINRPILLQELYLRAFKKSVVSLIGPTVVLLSAIWVLSRDISLHPAFLDLFHFVPYLFLFSAIALSWRFNQGRTFFLLLVVTLSYWGLDVIVRNHDSPPLMAVSVYTLICLLLPLNIAAFSLLKDLGIFTKNNIIRYTVLAAQITLVAIVANLESDTVLQTLYVQFDGTGMLEYLKLPEMAQIAFVIVLLVLIVQLFRHRTALDGNVIGVLIAMVLALDYEIGSLESISYSGLAGMMLLIAVVQDSYILAYHDELTGLPGRRALNEQMMRLGGQYVIAMVDIDHFKQFNDRYGHHTGDQVLRFVAAKLETVRGGGKAYRYGGEEFTILFQGKDTPAVLDPLEQIHGAIGGSEFVVRSKDRPKERPEQLPSKSESMTKVSVTVSIGVASKTERRPTPQHVLKAADRALYQAKKAGRNQIWM